MEEKKINEPIRNTQHKGITHTIILVLLFIVVLLVFGWTYFRYQSTNSLGGGNANSSVDDVRTQQKEDIIDKIGRLITLPQEENPVIATVDDPETLSTSQPFFKDVRKDDTLLIYEEQAIIYRGATDSIINTGHVTRSTDGTGSIETIVSNVDGEAIEGDGEIIEKDVELEPIVDPGKGISVEIRNGTAINGLAGKTRTELETDAYTVTSVGNASRNTYGTTLIISRSVKDAKDLEKRFTTVAITELPDNEEDTDADILLILGAE
jgi:hypothetical protein